MDQENTRIDPKLSLALSLTPEERSTNDLNLGYDSQQKTWRLIVKYNGDIEKVAKKYDAKIDILSDTFAIFNIPEIYIDVLADQKEVDYIEKPKRLLYQLDISKQEACISQVNNFPQYRLRGRGVIIGIIDSGIYYRHPDFINEDGTSKILFIWDQSIDGSPPASYTYGTEYTNKQINEALKQKTDEEAYEIVPHRDTNGHGTHVSSIAAGNGRGQFSVYEGVAPQSPLIVVKIGKADYNDYPVNTIDIMIALKYVIEKAESLNMPISINLSYGTAEGAHDGSSLFENYVNEAATKWKTCISVASGNEGDKGKHMSGNSKTEDTVRFAMQSGVQCLTVDIWKPQVDFYNIELISPRGISTGIIPYQNNQLKYTLGNEEIFVYFQKTTPFNTKENITFEMKSNTGVLNEGVWTIILHPDSVVIGDYDIWLSSNCPGKTAEFLSPTTENTITLPSTASNVISVASYNPLTGKISSFSGRGNELLYNSKPDLAAPGENISAANFNGGYDSLSGTSVAAPFVTGSCALLMEWGIVEKNDIYLYGQTVKSYLIAGARREENIDYPNIVWGYGKLCLLNSLELLMGIYDGNEISRSVIDCVRKDRMQNMSKKKEHSTHRLTNAEKINSNDYIDFRASFDSNLLETLKEFPDMILGYMVSSREAVIHVNVNDLNKVLKKITPVANLSNPILFGLMDVDALNEANILAVQNNPNLNLKGKGTLIGFLDTGIDYTHPAFVYEDGTSKIKALWDQTDLSGKAPKGFKYGTEYSQEQINAALQSPNPSQIVPMKDENGHGTFLAGVACGRKESSYIGAAPEAEIIFVKLAPAKMRSRHNCMMFNDDLILYQDVDVIAASLYLKQKALELNMPISICIGLGTNQGSHDGFSYPPITSDVKGVVISCAAGNEGNARKHSKMFFKETGETMKIEFNIAEGEKGVIVYIWGFAPDKFSISLTSPSGENIEKMPIANETNVKIKLVFYETIILVNYYIAVDRNGDPLAVVRMQNPEPGLWSFTLYGDYILNGRIDAWTMPKGWISDKTFFMKSDPDCTITEIGCSNDFITVGAYSHIDKNLYIDSSRGPTRYNLQKPDILAPGVNVSGPLPQNTYGVKTGTSVATAIVAGACALLLEWGIVRKNLLDMNTQIARSLLITGAERKKGITYPSEAYGFGNLDLLNSFLKTVTVTYDNSFNLYLPESDTTISKD